MIVTIGPHGLIYKPGEEPSEIAAFPPCQYRGPMVESGAKCRCGPKHLCQRDTRIVSAADCRQCLDDLAGAQVKPQ